MSMVYVVRDDGTTTPMTRARCTNEDLELQRILERNPDLLPGDQIDPEDPRRWLLLKREMPVPDPRTGQPHWSIDFLFADQDAVPTFVECKRFADTRARREIVGQMLEYAANGHHYWTRETLREVATETARASGSNLAAALRTLVPSDALSADAYFERVEQNLREGQLRIVFFLERSSPELRSIVDFLNRQMERSEVLLVEARQYTHEGSRIVTPVLFGYTEEARLVKRAVTVQSAAGRKKWDRTSYLADAAKRLASEGVAALAALLDNCLAAGCEVAWGTGSQRGSFNVKEPLVCPRSFLTCYSDGQLVLNFFWLNGSELADQAERRLRILAAERLGLSGGAADRPIGIETWMPKSSELIEMLRTLLAECRARAAADNRAWSASGRSDGGTIAEETS